MGLSENWPQDLTLDNPFCQAFAGYGSWRYIVGLEITFFQEHGI